MNEIHRVRSCLERRPIEEPRSQLSPTQGAPAAQLPHQLRQLVRPQRLPQRLQAFAQGAPIYIWGALQAVLNPLKPAAEVARNATHYIKGHTHL